VLDLMLDLVLDRVHAVTHDTILPEFVATTDVANRRAFARGTKRADAARRVCHTVVITSGTALS
jgi:hypothetical protein